MARTRRFQFHLGPFRTASLALLVITCISATAKGGRQRKTLFLLTGTCFLNDTSATFPARLYTVDAQHKLKLFRTVVSGSEGTTNILDDMRGEIYVTFPSNLGVSRAPTKVSIIHKQRPGEDDVIAFNSEVMRDLADARATAEGSDLRSYAIFVLFPQPPPTVNSHATFMRFIRSSATKLVAVAGNPPAKGPRVTRNDWALFRHLTFSGSPGGPGYSPPPEATVENRDLVLRYGGKTVFVDETPPALPSCANGHEIRIVAASPRFVVTWFFRTSDRSAPATLYVHARQLKRWREIKLPWSLPQSRIFGPWLATIAMSDEGGGGMWRDLNPGHKDERDRWVRDLLPNVNQGFETKMYTLIPGVLILNNLLDGRSVTLKTHAEDSEILDVRNDSLVLYRVNDEIFQAHIEGNKLSAPTLVVKGEDVSEVHWVFWTKAGTEGQTSASNVQTLFVQLESRASSSEAAEKLVELGKANAGVRKYLSNKLPGLIERARGLVWVNAVRLAGNLKLDTAAPVLAPYLQQWSSIAGQTDFAVTARFGNDPAGKALVEIGEASVSPVAQVLESGDRIGRWRAARILFAIGSAAAVQALRSHIPKEKDPHLKEFIASQFISWRREPGSKHRRGCGLRVVQRRLLSLRSAKLSVGRLE